MKNTQNNSNNISIAMTFKGREHFLNWKLTQLLLMDYDLKSVEICITVPKYSKLLLDICKSFYHKFYQIKLAISDRSVLPFKITTNQPTCDMNSQICNQVSFEKVIRTDPEVLFTSKKQLQYISNILEDPEICLWHDTYNLPENYYLNYFNNDLINIPKHNCESNTCTCFNKSTFIREGGFDERFALGIAAEDSYFINGFTWRGKSLKSDYDVVHLYHGPQWNTNPQLLKQYYDYTYPLFSKLCNIKEKANINNTDWQRPEMLSNEIILKD